MPTGPGRRRDRRRLRRRAPHARRVRRAPDGDHGRPTLSDLLPVVEGLPPRPPLRPGATDADRANGVPGPGGRREPPATDGWYRLGDSLPASSAVAIFGGATRKGEWVVPEQLTAFALFGGVELDLTEASFAGPEAEFTAIAVMGGVDITVPEGSPCRSTAWASSAGSTSRRKDRGSGRAGPAHQGRGVLRRRLGQAQAARSASAAAGLGPALPGPDRAGECQNRRPCASPPGTSTACPPGCRACSAGWPTPSRTSSSCRRPRSRRTRSRPTS